MPHGPAPRRLLLAALAALCAVVFAQGAAAQGGDHILYGDVKLEEDEAAERRSLSFEVILYTINGQLVSRQTVPNGGRYRFLSLPNGHYDVAVESEGTEVARVRAFVFSRFKSDFRQDISLAWRAGGGAPGARVARPQTVSAADFYARPAASRSLFEKAQAATDRKKYDDAVSLLEQLLASDPKDFQAWTELGTVHLLAGEAGEAEKAYRRAVAERPAFSLALLNLGRLLMSQKKYEAAVEPLAAATRVQPPSAEANFLLGEVYLQLRQGSKAVPHLTEAARLGRHDAHLRLGALYNAAGLKDRAALEYEQFISKEPKHPDRKRLEQYVAAHKKKN